MHLSRRRHPQSAHMQPTPHLIPDTDGRRVSLCACVLRAQLPAPEGTAPPAMWVVSQTDALLEAQVGVGWGWGGWGGVQGGWQCSAGCR